MLPEFELLISALAKAVANKPFAMPGEAVNWERFTRLCHAHAVAPLVYEGFRKADVLSLVPADIRNALLAQWNTAIFRDSQFEYMKMKLSEKMVAAKIPHIFLKGSCLKYDYPEPALRTMCDLDILVHSEDFAALGAIAEELGGQAAPGDGNHRNYHFKSGVAVEFHPNLLHHDAPVGSGINPGWQYAKKDMPTSAGMLTEEGFYLNTLCHLAGHFVAGGVGVRFVLDVWVNRHLRKPQPDRAFVESELRRFGLLDFAVNIEALADWWFGTGTKTPLLEELGLYILTSGSHGMTDRAMLNAVAMSEGGSRVSALMQKAFYSRQEMEDRFTWCKGKPWLLPAAWCVRAFRAVTQHGHLVLKWSKDTKNLSKNEIRSQKELLRRFGIQK